MVKYLRRQHSLSGAGAPDGPRAAVLAQHASPAGGGLSSTARMSRSQPDSRAALTSRLQMKPINSNPAMMYMVTL